MTITGCAEDRLSYRAEGESAFRTTLHIGGYLSKYLRKHLTTTPERTKYFDLERALIRDLAKEQLPPKADSVSLAFVGDIMWIRNNWDSFLDPDLLSYLNTKDVVLGNLETLVSDRRKPSSSLLPEALAYNSPPQLITAFSRGDRSSTFRALSIINNHTLDYDDQDVRSTRDFLSRSNIFSSGVSETREQITDYVAFHKKNINFGFYAAGWGVNFPSRMKKSKLCFNTVDGFTARDADTPLFNIDNVKAALYKMSRDKVDFKIVYLHIGYEFEMYPTAKVMSAMHETVKAGADLVFASHPHVVQPNAVCLVDGYKMDAAQGKELPKETVFNTGGRARKALIAYSMGNFTTAMYTNLCRLGLIESIEVCKDPKTGVTDWSGPSTRLVFNGFDPGTQKRITTFADRQVELLGESKEKARLQRDIQYLNRHLMGEPACDSGKVKERLE